MENLLKWCEGIAPVVIRDDWRSLGTYVPGGAIDDGIVGPAIVIAGQILDRADSPVSYAVILHEVGHALDTTPRPIEGTAEDREQYEVTANAIAANLIIEHFMMLGGLMALSIF